MTLSLRARLVGSVSAVAFVALAVAGTTTYVVFTRSQLNQIANGLQRVHQPIEDLVAVGGADLEQVIGQVSPGTFVAVEDSDGSAPNGTLLDPSDYVKGWAVERAAAML